MGTEITRVQRGTPLVCRHCGMSFAGTRQQRKHRGRGSYCSEACRLAGFRKLQCTPIPNRGPCPVCKEVFFSRSAKVYCSMACYTRSPQFREMVRNNGAHNQSPEVRAKIVASMRTGSTVACVECGKEFYKKRKLMRRFCSRTCYRAYFARRFDRWIANPEEMQLPQCYDEFLDNEELPCLVAGCGWRGRHLSLHVNQTHGCTADEFKRAAGFNLNTGVIARPLAEMLSRRELMGVALLSEVKRAEFQVLGRDWLSRPRDYQSFEAHEHRVKAAHCACESPGPIRQCRQCGELFQQRVRMGRALYCSLACRNRYYSLHYVRPPRNRNRVVDKRSGKGL